MDNNEEQYEPIPVVRRPRIVTAVCIFWILSTIIEMLITFLAGLFLFSKAFLCCCPTALYFGLQNYFFVTTNRILMGRSRTTLVAAIMSTLLGVVYIGLGMFEYLYAHWLGLKPINVALFCLFGIWRILAGVLAGYYNGQYRRWASRLDPRPDVDQNDDDPESS